MKKLTMTFAQVTVSTSTRKSRIAVNMTPHTDNLDAKTLKATARGLRQLADQLDRKAVDAERETIELEIRK